MEGFYQKGRRVRFPRVEALAAALARLQYDCAAAVHHATGGSARLWAGAGEWSDLCVQPAFFENLRQIATLFLGVCKIR